MSYWEDRLGHRPPVSVNIEHLLDLAGRDRLLLRSSLDEIEVGLSGIVEKFELDSHGRGHLMAVGDPVGALLQSFLAEQALDRSSSFVDSNGVLQPHFESRDLVLLHGFTSWRARHVSAKRAQPVRGIDVLDIPAHARIAVFGDWGIGTRASRLVADSIERAAVDAVIHLGDVYYSGTEDEVMGYLVDAWPVDPSEVPSRACNSNHEMYAGGRSFEQTTLPFLGQSSSLFALRNANWLFVGLDTGTIDGELSAGQVSLVEEFLDQNPHHDVALLSHHPIYSLESGVEKRMWNTVQPLIRGGRVSRWYSAHEHASVEFSEDDRGLRVRCVGNGGFPYLLPTTSALSPESSLGYSVPPGTDSRAPQATVRSGPSQYRLEGLRYGPEGWLEVATTGRNLTERLVEIETDEVPADGWTS